VILRLAWRSFELDGADVCCLLCAFLAQPTLSNILPYNGHYCLLLMTFSQRQPTWTSGATEDCMLLLMLLIMFNTVELQLQHAEYYW